MNKVKRNQFLNKLYWNLERQHKEVGVCICVGVGVYKGGKWMDRWTRVGEDKGEQGRRKFKKKECMEKLQSDVRK